MTIIVASHNEGKVREIKKYFEKAVGDARQPFLAEILSLADVGFSADLDLVEDGLTFEENAVKKAEFVRDKLGTDFIVLADDSGLEIDALDGLPGVDSANFMGRDTPYTKRFEWILSQVGDKPRDARFVAVMALAFDNRTVTFKATMEGEIALAAAGLDGFGYDPIFYLPEHGLTSAQISLEEKNKISHRGKALEKVVEYLHENFGV